MKQLLFLLFTTTVALAQVSPPGGAVTLQPGAGTVQPTGTNVPEMAPAPDTSAGNVPASPDLLMAGFQRFDDPILNSLIQDGLSNSPGLRAAISRIEEVRRRVRIAQSYLQPSIRSSVLVSTQSLSEHRPVAIPIATDRLPRFQLNTFQLLPLDTSWELDLFKRIRSGIMLAQQQTQASEADLRAFRLSLASDIARTYYLIRGNEAEQAVFLRNIATRDSTVGIVRERFRVGLVNQVDVQRAETDLAGLRVQLIGLQRTRAELVNALAQLAAQEPATFNLGIGTLPALPSRPINSAAAPICFRPIGRFRSRGRRWLSNRPVFSRVSIWWGRAGCCRGNRPIRSRLAAVRTCWASMPRCLSTKGVGTAKQ